MEVTDLEEFEAAVWRVAWKLTHPARAHREAGMAAVRDAADAYGRAAYGVTAERRAVIGVRPSTARRDQRATARRSR